MSPLARLLLLCLEGLLAVAPYHDCREEAANHGRSQHNEDDRDADCPDAGEEEGLEDVVVVDKRLA